MKTEQIVSIPIMQVLDKLGIRYFPKGAGEYGIYENGEKTSGRSFNTNKNIIKDFSHDDRPQGDVFWFVKNHLSLDDSKTFAWFEDNFGIENKQKKSVMQIWGSLPELNTDQQNYLLTRWIEYNKIKWIVKSYNGGVGCLIYEGDIAKGLNARTLSSDKDKRFTALSGYPTKWVYKNGIDTSKNYLFVVEWLIDFLTLRQHDTNVIWLKSAESGIDDVIALANKYDIYFIGDNDEAGRKTRDKLQWIRYKFFDISKYDEKYKDINDLYCDIQSPEILDAIKGHSEYIAPITSTIEKFKKRQEVIQVYGRLGYDWPYKAIYDYTQGVIPWKVYTIGAYSNTGKSKFAYYHIQYFLSIGKKVALLSLEVDEAMCFWNIVCARENVSMYEIHNYVPAYQKYNNLTIRDDLYDLEKIGDFIMWGWYDIVFIDFVQNINAKGSAYEKNALIAQSIQRFAIQSNTTIYSLSQLSNSAWRDVQSWRTDFVPLKWAWEYFASSDVIFILQRDEKDFIVKIAKNKFWPKEKEFYMNVDRSKNQFIYIKENKDGVF